MLLSGKVDAILTAQPPRSFLTGNGAVRHLIPDYAAEEETYFRKTSIFPVMHTTVLR
ncbi:hypothetical protein [Muricoccus radiodurans]|uniref:hypothetical protein n=1 Tax=Muricoccus radiodurans TaxID=2231721 RepID=UPI003CEDD2EB